MGLFSTSTVVFPFRAAKITKLGGVKSMKRIWASVTLLAALLALSACAGSAPAFRDVDLTSDLDAATLARYGRQLAAADKTAEKCHFTGHHMATLERTNWWPLGLVAYWKRGSVQAMHTTSGEWNYMVSKSTGLGPLAALFVRGEMAAFDSKGKRLSYMSHDGVGFGHLLMAHSMGSRLEGGDWMEHQTYSIFHHLLNIGTGHGRPSVWLFSAPNPAGF